MKNKQSTECLLVFRKGTHPECELASSKGSVRVQKNRFKKTVSSKQTRTGTGMVYCIDCEFSAFLRQLAPIIVRPTQCSLFPCCLTMLPRPLE